jgi:DNA-nicking Smr family endonuclease
MSRRRKTPGHTAEDRALWARVTETVTPLRPSGISRTALMSGDAGGAHEGRSPRTEKDPKPRPRVAPFRVGSKSPTPPPIVDRAPDPAQALTAAPPQVDGRTHGRLRRGKLRPEARIDLHGMTLAQAHPALTRFLTKAHADDQRLVLVITGKGKDRDDGGVMPVRRGVLRHQVPHWLQASPLRYIVVQITPAHFRHGGDGAYYVYLRRAR